MHNRQVQRTQRAIKAAFTQLLKERNYASITIDLIAERADIGRSTFYRYHATKVDLLLSWHEDVFNALEWDRQTPQQWLSPDPDPSLEAFFARMQHSRMAFHDFGPDGPLVFRRIGALLSARLEGGLRNAGADLVWSMPLPLVALALSGIYGSLFQWWIWERPTLTPAEAAAHTHRLLRSIILGALAQ